ncbi:MAG: EAL domain-containing protein [Gammaproteobacteria bacterium]|jgi:diguanylate cyclase (GGDEF)-like protein|nr:EAL domain-containing protein [Gammaproteobacteria bacterium]MBT7308250.1 EAL domain-containing protein [Gammaproteobacteria bacterium]
MMLRTVLLVDDERQVLETYRVILSEEEADEGLDELAAIVGIDEEKSETTAHKQEQFHLIEATQGEEAVEKQRLAIEKGDAPYVALVDMRMPPGINGLETAIRLRQQDPSIYIIIVTAYSDVGADTIQLALQHDFIFLKKPVTPEELYQMVRNAANAYKGTDDETNTGVDLDRPLYQDQASRQKVLLVDDEPMTLRLAEAMLTQHLAVDVLTASTGQEALRVAHELLPDLIMLDVRMSGMDGFTVCRALKTTDDTKEIPVIFLTAQSSEEHVVRGFQAGAVDYVAKPFSQPILVARVSTHLNLYQQSRRLKMLSNTDALTELPNRMAFQTYLDMRLRDAAEAKEQEGDAFSSEAHEFALLFIDLDRFKPVNDELGHEVGDKLLQSVAGRMRKSIREVDLLSRIGGDEFVLMLGGGASQENVSLIADKMVHLLCQPFKIDEHLVQIGASIGSARFPQDAEEGEDLVKHADMAMYEAKAKGRNRHVPFSKDFEAYASEREQMAAELRTAIADEQMQLLFQPRLLLKTERIVGVDALLRWNHPERGVLEASQFIDLLMDGRLGEMAEHWIFKRVCQQLVAWGGQCGFVLPVTINLSEQRFNQKELVEQIVDVANSIGMPVEMLGMIEFDIREELLMKRPEFALEQLGKLQELGIRITLDNFGSGRSSISWLQRFPLTGVKLDRRLIQEIGEQKADEVLGAALSLIQALGYTTIAEGIETQPQLDFLTTKGCDSGLGYLLRGPITEKEIVSVLEELA